MYNWGYKPLTIRGMSHQVMGILMRDEWEYWWKLTVQVPKTYITHDTVNGRLMGYYEMGLLEMRTMRTMEYLWEITHDWTIGYEWDIYGISMITV